ncbi:MAG: general secretion pathway protein GspK [Bdellovibrionales bacterium]|nr:general secretion pathway protein GspK [Bdellovibrionales bacterium]
MEFIPAFRKTLMRAWRRSPAGDERGVALFMVVASVAVLVILATEFIYIAQINQRVAYDSADKVRAHYVAKSGLKLSLLRLKAYQHIKGYISGGAGGGGNNLSSMVPKGLVERVWSFPLIFPVPTDLPGMSEVQKLALKKFQDDSALVGSYSALIESESAKFNLNQILAPFAPKKEEAKKDSKKPGTPAQPASPDPDADPADPDAKNPDQKPQFDPAKARQSLQDFLTEIFAKKAEEDEDFGDLYRDLTMEELVDAIAAWSDRSYERRFPAAGSDTLPLKRGPFYSLTELHMVPLMDDGLFNLFAPSLTVSPTPGINVNTMPKETLRALIPGLTEEEVKEFFEYRDSQKEDNLFKTVEDFLKYAENNFGVFRGSPSEVSDFKAKLEERNIRLLTDESEFKITVISQVNNVSKQLEAYVTLAGPKKEQNPGQPPAGGQNPDQPPAPGQGTQPGFPEGPLPPESGLKIHFMRIY